MSLRLERIGWGEAEGWLRLQANYDLSQARKKEERIVAYPVAQEMSAGDS